MVDHGTEPEYIMTDWIALRYGAALRKRPDGQEAPHFSKRSKPNCLDLKGVTDEDPSARSRRASGLCARAAEAPPYLARRAPKITQDSRRLPTIEKRSGKRRG